MRETLHFQSRDGLRVFAYFLLPKKFDAPLPALLCLHGHGYGVDALVGLDEFGKPIKGDEYHHAFALQAVRHGYATLAIEILGFGRRREGIAQNEFEKGSRNSSCQTLSGNALMLGQTIAGWRTYDAVRAIDYLETRVEVDKNRIGNMGISGGGLNALFHAAVDERVRASMVSGYFNTFRESVMQINHCIDNFIPGLASDFEMTDLAAMVAPRALWCESGTQDTIFPVKSFRRALREAKQIYSAFGADEKIGGEVFEGDHQFYGKGAWKFLEKHLKG
jgi:dienelactone hydrolase